MAGADVLDAAVGEVAVEPGLVDRADRPDAHGDGGELPEVRHEPRVRVGRQAVAAELLAEAVELVGGQPALEERAGVHAGGGVALEVDLVAGDLAISVLAPEEVVPADLVELGGTGERGDVAADVGGLVGPGDHDRGVPPDDRPDALLELLVTGELGLGGCRDRVDVVGGAHLGDADAPRLGVVEQLEHQVAGPALALRGDDRVERVAPLLGLRRVDVGDLGERREGLLAAGGGIGSESHARPYCRCRVALVCDLLSVLCGQGWWPRLHAPTKAPRRHLWPPSDIM